MNKQKFSYAMLSIGMLLLLFGMFREKYASSDSASEATQTNVEQVGKVKNIIFIIGDGMGPNQINLVGDSANNFERSHSIGFSKTYSASHRVTDSAAGGTALACGVKTNNGVLGMNADSVPVQSIMQELRQSGLATGEVASCRITHATPAAFYAHQVNRGMDAEILSDLYKYGPDVFVAGGNKLISTDSLQNAGYQVTYSLDSMANIADGKVACILAEEDMPTSPMRGDTIAQGVLQTLRLLEKNEKGFFLFIEGSQIDWAGHGNEGERLRAEMKDINRVIGVCMDYADQHPGTLVFITADHETGGLSLPNEELTPTFSTGSHSGVMVPFFAYGTGADKLTGIHENTDFKALLLSLVDCR